MNALQQFLIENDVTKTVESFKLDSTRLKDFEFKVSAVTNKQYQNYQKAAVTIVGKKRDFNMSKFNMLIIVNHCLEPDFKDQKFLEACGIATPEDCVNRTLKAGEVLQLSEKILQLSGFNLGDLEGDMEEVKNS